MKDIKVFDELNEMMAEQKWWGAKHSPIEFFAEAVARTRQERQEMGVSIEGIGKCFRYQFDEAELSALIHELNKGKL